MSNQFFFFRKDKSMFLASLVISLYVFLLYFNTYILCWNFVLIGVLQEMLTLPTMLLELVLLFFTVKEFIFNKFHLKSYSFATLIILLVNIILTWGSLLPSFF